MKICMDISIKDFDFWSGAKDRRNVLTDEQCDTIEDILNTEYPNGISDTELNDLMWFDENTIANWLGFRDFEELEKVNALDDYENIYRMNGRYGKEVLNTTGLKNIYAKAIATYKDLFNECHEGYTDFADYIQSEYGFTDFDSFIEELEYNDELELIQENE